MTMTLELTDDVLKKLKELAQQTAVSPEEIAVEAINEHVAHSQDNDHRRRVREAGEYVQQKNAELYRRLA